jgi:hypothetical protein
MTERAIHPVSERAIQNEILLAASAAGWTLFRQNVGVGWQGKHTRLPDGSILIQDPRPLHAGLCTGSSDLIGWRPILIGTEHVGRIIAQFIGIEVKTPKGRESKEQAHFREVANAAGGLVVVARGVEDLPA